MKCVWGFRYVRSVSQFLGPYQAGRALRGISLRPNTLPSLVALAAVMGMAAITTAEPARDTREGRRYTVEARVEYAKNSGTNIQAQLSPGDFTIPEGFYASDFRYSFGDVKTGKESNRIGPRTIYSVTEKRFVSEARSTPDFTLKPGKYRFSVGGMPGAVGTLSYTLRRGFPSGHEDDQLAEKADRIIEVTTWSTTKPEEKYTEVYYIKGKKVVGRINQELKGTPDNPHYHSEPIQLRGEFVGVIEENVIRGHWKVTGGPYRVTITHVDGRSYGRTDSFQSNYDAELTLQPGGSIKLVVNGNGETVWEYDDVALQVKEFNVTEKTFRHSWSIPPEGVEWGMEGTWKETSSAGKQP